MERNVTLDCFKIILSILVITIHINFLFAKEALGGWLISEGIARIAVPCFFLINGYYFAPKINNKEAVKKYILHLLLIYLVWALLVLPDYINQLKTLDILKMLVFGHYHLWYVPALLFGIALLVFLKKYIKKDIYILLLGLFFFIVAYLLERPTPKPVNFMICRGLFTGVSFVFVGYYIRVKELKNYIKDYLLIILGIIFTTLLLVESYFSYTISSINNIYLSLIILCPVLFLLILKHSIYKQNNDFLSYLGSLASAIYFVHYFVIFKVVKLPLEYTIYKLPLVVLISVLYSIVIIYINKRVKIFL